MPQQNFNEPDIIENKGSGDLLDLKDSGNTTRFAVSSAGAVVASGTVTANGALLGSGYNGTPRFLGDWSSGTAYIVGDAVYLSSAGSSYVCKVPHTNQTPPNATYWYGLANKGDTGAAGPATDATTTVIGSVLINRAKSGTHPVALTTDDSGAVSGVASLDSSSHVTLTQLSGLTTTNLSASAAIVSGQIASVAAATITGTNTLPDGVLSTNVPLINAANVFTNAKNTFNQAPAASANNGLINLGPGAFDGATTGKFVGVAAGTLLGINLASGGTQAFVDYQLQGVSKFRVDSTGLITFPFHLKSSGGTVTAAAAGNAGGSPPAPVKTLTTDVRGTVTFGTGTSPSAGSMVTVTFATTYGAAPIVVVCASNAATAALQPYLVSSSATTFVFGLNSAPAAGQGNTIYSFNYIVML